MSEKDLHEKQHTPERCGSCGGVINIGTGECRCSD